MIFSELYSAYYNAVAGILKEACAHPLPKARLRAIVEREAFGESLLNIEPAILDERWQLLKADGTTPIRHAPSMPLTLLQRRWLKAISLDPRIRLFPELCFDDPEVEPLFRPEDIDFFDRYADGDPYGDEAYIRRFRLILEAVRDQAPLSVEAASPKGKMIRRVLMPQYLEYSEKDDKFRLAGYDGLHRDFVNLARIVRCGRFEGEFRVPAESPEAPKKKTVELALTDDRNALERALMHFAHFEKQAERLEANRYKIKITYNEEDETEMLIRILAFGPMLRIVAPDGFTDLVRERLARQKKLGNVFGVSSVFLDGVDFPMI